MLALVGRFNWRFWRALAAVLSLALVAGLFASAPPVQAAPPARAAAAAAPIPLSLTVDPGGTAYNPSDMAAIIQQVLNESPEVSDAIKRLVTENSLPLAGANINGWGNGFHGTITATSDNTGLTFTVNAADAPQSPTDAFWQTYFTGAVSSALGMIARAECMTFLKSRVPGANDEQSKIVKATCSSLGSIIVSFFTAVITAAWDGQAPSQTTLATDLGKAIATAFFGSILWDTETWNWVTNSLINVFAVWLGTIAVQTTWPWLQATYRAAAALLSNWNNPANAVAAVVLAWRTPVSASTLPCDTYDAGGAPCVDAYSTTRTLYSTYNGPMYQVQRASDEQTQDIYPVAVGGLADAAAQNTFCAGTTCTITKLYDESPDWDDLTVSQGGGAANQPDHPAYAAALPVQLGTQGVWGLDVTPGVGYRDNGAQLTATKGEPEGMYMVASGTNVNSGCCFDFGNAETDANDNSAGHMDAVNLSTTCFFQGSQGPCTGSGPWVEADLEDGLFQGGNGTNTANTGNGSNFVTAVLNNDGQKNYQIEGGNAESGGLTTYWNGSLPTIRTSGTYIPRQQEGAVILGTGGDNSNSDVGSFFEGAMTIGYPTSATDFAVQQNIVAADYNGKSGGTTPPPAVGAAASAAGPAVVHSAGATGAGASGFSSVYTVDSANQHLQESYLPYMGDSWTTQDLSATGGTLPGTPPVMPGTKPVALVHCGYTSVYTVDADSGDLQETYLPAIGDAWVTQDLSAKYHTPPTNVTPTAVVHAAGATGAAAACGFTSVYTVDTSNGHLQETYLPYIGDAWTTQDLGATGGTLPGTPEVQAGTSPVAVVHCGWTSVYTVDWDHQLQETYLPAIGDAWSTQSLPAPLTSTTPTAVVHTAGATGSAATCGFTSVYTVDQSNNHLDETYLPLIGLSWNTQDLSATGGTLPGTPPVAPGTAPVALVHTGYTSVYTVDEGTDHLQETYLPAIGDAWTTQDLTVKYPGTPTTAETPIVLLHPDTTGALTWTSVYTINEFSDHLDETYLQALGDAWVSQDLSAKYSTPSVAVSGSGAAGWSVSHAGYTSVYTVDKSGNLDETYLTAMGKTWATQDLSGSGGFLPGAPKVLAGTAPVAVVHAGYTSVYTIDAGDSLHDKGDLQETYLPAIGGSWYTQDLSFQTKTPPTAVTPAVVYHGGYTSVYTTDASNGQLWETYLTKIGAYWTAQNLSANYRTPPVDAYTSPTAVYHDGFTSVYTVDTTNAADGSTLGQLQETYLQAIGDQWATQNLSANYQTPLVNVLTSPTAVVHNGYVSVYTVNEESNVARGDLQETYLPYMGSKWYTQDLSGTGGDLPGTPKVEAGTAPVALYHTGYTSVYTVDEGSSADLGHIQETYLPAIGGPWITQDMSAYGTPVTNQAPTALLHYDTSGALTWTSIFSADTSGNLWETYLPAIGDVWSSQSLAVQAKTPAMTVQQQITGPA
jgi:Alpha-L-arabinofuranosidase B, catalytic